MKKLLLLFIMTSMTYLGYGQCTPDAVLAIDANCVGTTGGANSGDPTGNDPIDVNPCSNSYAGGDDYIFSYTATTADALDLELFGTGTWSGLMVTDACPDDPAATCIGSSNSSASTESFTTPALTPGTTYYIHISTWPSPQSIGQFCLNATLVTPVMPPANDDCPNATPLTVNADLNCGTTTPGTIEAATASPEDDTACAGTEDDDVWFSFVATNTTHQIDLLNLVGSTTDLYHSLWEGPCGAGATNLTCSDPNTSVATGLTVGTTYYLRVYSWTSATGQTTSFDVCIGTPPPPPQNDDICNAVVLACDDATSGSTIGATGGISSSCLGSQGDNVWYAITGTGGTIEITVNSTTAGEEPQIDIYTSDSDCTGILTCDSGTGAGTNPVTAILSSVAGTVYYVAVGHWINGSPSFDFDISVVCPTCPDPTGLSVANETASSVEVSWTQDPALTSATVEVCPTGVAPGDPSCIVVTPATSPQVVSGLAQCSDYDAYVSGMCNADMTAVVGPVGFSTTGPAPDLMPACGSTITYPTCPGATYNSNENITWTLCATPGTVAEIVFTYVDIESTTGCGWDAIDITYSDATTSGALCGEPDGDGGVGSGLASGSTFTDPTPGGCMTVTFTSDGSVQETGFSFDFSCVAPCDAPNNLILVPSATTVVAPPTAICDNANGYTYYEDPGTGNYVFAINWGTANAAAKAAATITVTQAAAMGYTEGGVPNVSGDATWTMERYWDVDLGGTTLAAPVDVRFYYIPAEKTAVDNAQSGDVRPNTFQDWFKTNTGPYSGTPTTVSPATGNETILAATLGVESGIDYAEFFGVASFSGGTYGASVGGTVLPIDLVSIKGTAMADHNRLDWETATEINNDYQSIERSADGRNNWKEIGRVDGRNTQTLETYSVLDNLPLKNSYYRLKSVDFNGNTQYSEVVNINRDRFAAVRSIISPNPFASDLEVTLESDSDQNAKITVFSLDGKMQHQINVQLRATIVHKELLQLDDLQTGIYLMQINMGDYNETQRIVKVQ